MSATMERTAYDLLGGEVFLRRLVDRFYDHMASDADVRTLREMHAADLGPMRTRLFEFLSGWLGGPPLYFERADRKCIVSAHAPFAIDAQARDEWMTCMRRALADTGVEPMLGEAVERALYRFADALRSR